MRKKLLIRIASALALAPVVILCILFGGIPFFAMIALAFAISLWEFWGLSKVSITPFKNMVFGALYLIISFASFAYLRYGFENAGTYLATALIITVWACDIGAYVCGKIIGGKKLAPKISPNKTWAGLVGGSIMSGLLLAAIFAKTSATYELSVFYFFVGVVVGLVGQAGDLLISYFKRKVGAKDTGDLIPGHGGLLDRIDALLLASPVYLLIIWVGANI